MMKSAIADNAVLKTQTLGGWTSQSGEAQNAKVAWHAKSERSCTALQQQTQQTAMQRAGYGAFAPRPCHNPPRESVFPISEVANWALTRCSADHGKYHATSSLLALVLSHSAGEIRSSSHQVVCGARAIICISVIRAVVILVELVSIEVRVRCAVLEPRDDEVLGERIALLSMPGNLAPTMRSTY